jgi:hypothetical protein
MMNRKLFAAALLVAILPAQAQGQGHGQPTRVWWCQPSGMTNFTPLFRIIWWSCGDSRPMDR